MQRVKIFTWLGNGEASGYDCSVELEKEINSYIKRYSNLRIVSIHPMMNSGIDWTEYSIVIVFDVIEAESASAESEEAASCSPDK